MMTFALSEYQIKKACLSKDFISKYSEINQNFISVDKKVSQLAETIFDQIEDNFLCQFSLGRWILQIVYKNTLIRFVAQVDNGSINYFDSTIRYSPDELVEVAKDNRIDLEALEKDLEDNKMITDGNKEEFDRMVMLVSQLPVLFRNLKSPVIQLALEYYDESISQD